MQYLKRGDDRRRYEASLLDGPLAGTQVLVGSLPDGGPLEVLPIVGGGRGAYVLAGLASFGGHTPYRWVTREEWAGLRRWLRLGKVRPG